MAANALYTLNTLAPEKNEQQLVNRIVLQKMLQQALQVNNPSKQWFADIIKKQLAILAAIAQKQQEQGIDIPPEVRAILDPKALMSGKTCLKVSKGGKGTKVPRGLVDPSCVRDSQWVYNKNDNQVYVISKNAKGKKSWEKITGLDKNIRQAFKKEHQNRGGVIRDEYAITLKE